MRTRSRRLLAIAALVGLPGLAARADDPAPLAGAATPERALRLQLRIDGWLASAEGDLQTPKGGRPGSTSNERPTIREVGLDGLDVVPRVDLGLAVLGHELHLSYDLALLRGGATVGRTLTSQAQTFAPGERVTSGVDLQGIRIGYRARWLRLELGGWRFVPEVGLALTTFRYTLVSRSSGGRVARSYSFASPYLALLVIRPLVRGLDLELEAGGCGEVNGVSLIDAEARLSWTPWTLEGVDVGLELGVRGTWMRRKDGQPLVQNDPDVRLGAFSTDPVGGVTLGVRLVF